MANHGMKILLGGLGPDSAPIRATCSVHHGTLIDNWHQEFTFVPKIGDVISAWNGGYRARVVSVTPDGNQWLVTGERIDG